MSGYPPATIARRLACGVCPLCEDPGKPVAARSGFTHEHASLLCVEHLLEALGMPLERPAPAALPPDPAAVRAAFRASLRQHAEHDAAPTAVTLARQAPPPALEPETLAAALECMRQLGAVPLRNEPTYGVPCGWGCAWRPPTPKAVREYDPGGPVAWDDEVTIGLPGLEVGLDDEAVPNGARKLGRAAVKAGWAVRVVAGPETVILGADRGGLRVTARYERGRLAAGWARAAGDPVPCTDKQLGAILKAAGR